MTDLGNGLFTVSIPKESEKLLLDSYGTIFYRIGKKLKTINTRKENHQILGTVTKDNISFDVEPYVPSDHGMLNNQYYFRWLLASKGLHFDNNLIEKLVIIKKV